MNTKEIQEILDAACRVVDIQTEYDSQNHATTNCDYIARLGDQWAAQRSAIMGELDERRTYAIWALARLLPETSMRREREVGEALLRATYLAISAAATLLKDQRVFGIIY